MRFRQLDRVVEMQPGVRIVAEKKLLAEEDYLRDHFPHFPVMPGVLMLEAMYQAGAWLVYASDDFQRAVVRLHEARNIRFADFVEPGETLIVTAEIAGRTDDQVTIKAQGSVADAVAVSGRLILETYNPSDRETVDPTRDQLVRLEMRRRFGLLNPPAQQGATAGPPTK